MDRGNSLEAAAQPAGARVIEVTLETPKHLFHALDPSPMLGRDLDEQVEKYILECARELAAPNYALTLYVPSSEIPARKDERACSDAVRAYFSYRRDEELRKLRSLLREGWQTLVIGLGFLFICGAVGLAASRQLNPPLGTFLSEGLLIIGWVALWHPIQILLYDWRPVRRECRILAALAAMPVEFRTGEFNPERATAPAPQLLPTDHP